MEMTQIVIGQRPVPVSRRPKAYAVGRVCAADGCETRVSQYNKEDRCYLHQPVKRPRLRGKMPSERMEIEEQVSSKCRSCSQIIRRLENKPAEVYIDGVRHYEGLAGEATRCEVYQ